jgi:hypothetical protein
LNIPTETSAVRNISFASAFQVDFVERDLIPFFVAKVQDTVAEWKANPDEYYGPYFAICQSSGYGKSRLVVEAIKQKVYGCYISLADITSTAYPPRSERFAETLIYAGNNEVHMDAVRKYIAIALSVFVEYLSSTESPTPQSWHAWSTRIPSQKQPSELEGVLRTIRTVWKGPTSTPFVFAFDEARILVDSYNAQGFRNVRAVLQEISKMMLTDATPFHLCGTFMDTTSKVANFAATSMKEDPSAREHNIFKKTFHPLFILPSVDIFQEDVLRLGRYVYCMVCIL